MALLTAPHVEICVFYSGAISVIIRGFSQYEGTGGGMVEGGTEAVSVVPYFPLTSTVSIHCTSYF